MIAITASIESDSETRVEIQRLRRLEIHSESPSGASVKTDLQLRSEG